MATSTNFVGKNTRSMSLFLNEQNSNAEFIKNPHNGKIFVVLTDTPADYEHHNVAVSEACQAEINANGLGSLSDYQVTDMPAKDAATGQPNGKVFFLVTRKGTNNSLGTLCR